MGRVASSNNIHFQWHTAKVQSVEDAKKMESPVAAAGAGMSKVDAHRILSALSGQDADGETQLEGPRGSVVIMNYLTQHGTARHLGAAPRLALYFRIKTALTAPGADYDFRKLSNAWHEWQ